MQKVEYKFGIYGGIALCIFKILEFLPVFQKTRIESGIDTGLLALVIAAAFVMWGVKKRRNLHKSNSISFSRALITGVIITVLMTIIIVPFIYTYGKFINPTEAAHMNEYIKSNPGDYSPPDLEAIVAYYEPGHRSMQTGKEILLTGLLVSLFSGIMFRRLPVTERDFVKESTLPSKARSFFTLTMIFSQLPVVVYIAWFLNRTNISTFLFELLTDPLTDADELSKRNAFVTLLEGTAFIALAAVILNFVCYKKIAAFGHDINIWNLRMILVDGLLFLITLWPILHSL